METRKKEMGVAFTMDSARQSLLRKLHNETPKKPTEIPYPGKNPETIPTEEPQPGVWPKKEPEIQPEHEPLTVPPTAPPEIPTSPQNLRSRRMDL
ncbi:MAG: hypothetical protein ACOYXT_17565 [Bacteroidota bacterium]